MIRIQKLTCAAIAVSALAAGAADDLFEDRVIVRGPEYTITENQLDQALIQRRAQMTAKGLSIPEHLRAQVEKETVDLLILKHSLLNMATDEDRTNALAFVDSQISQSPADLLSKQAKLLGLTPEAFKQELVDQNTATLVVQREFAPRVEVTEEQSRTFYDENPGEFEVPEMVTVRHILFAVRTPQGQVIPADQQAAKKELAEKVLVRARDGEDFLALVAEYSEDQSVEQNNGQLTFPRGQMVPEFEAAAWHLEPNQISDLVKTDFGYHIIRKNANVPARVVPFEEADGRIREVLKAQKMQKVLQDYTQDLKKDPSIQILDDRYKS